MKLAAFALCAIVVLLGSPWAPASSVPEISTSNNDQAAGKITGKTTELLLEITSGSWRPEEDNGPSLEIQAFAEAGKAPQIPGPTLRVPQGSTVLVKLRNRLTVPAKIHGFPPARGTAGDPVTVQPGASRSLRFKADHAGYFYYWASTTDAKSLQERHLEDSQLSGVLVVESREQAAHGKDPIFVLGHWWIKNDPRELWVINGKMWPFTPRYEEKVGKPFRSIWINGSDEGHPMHLHGSYFSVLRESIQGREVAHQPDDTPFVTTHVLEAGDFMEIQWTPLHAGNWLFHCHILFHTDFGLGLKPVTDRPAHMEHSGKHMSGLAVGFTATEDGPKPAPAETSVRRLKLIVGERKTQYESFPGYGLPDKLTGLGYQLVEGDAVSSADPVAPGPPIILQRNQPVEITVENHLKESTSVHWHGIELESYYDGVPGWGGDSNHITPSIPPGGTFVAKFTPPRAGSFMYHTHLNDFLQLSLGLCGPLVVLDPDEMKDREHDRIFMITRDGPDDEKAPYFINGSGTPPAMPLQSGATYRLRFFELTTAQGSRVSIVRKDGQPVQWKPFAKDGATLAESQRIPLPATTRIETGETFDFLFTPEKGEYRLQGTNTKSDVLFTVDLPAN